VSLFPQYFQAQPSHNLQEGDAARSPKRWATPRWEEVLFLRWSVWRLETWLALAIRSIQTQLHNSALGTRIVSLSQQQRWSSYNHYSLSSESAVTKVTVGHSDQLNFAADALLWQVALHGEWRLHPNAVQLIWSQFGKAQVDLFASQEFSHYPLWYSLPEAPLCTDDGMAPGAIAILVCIYPQWAWLHRLRAKSVRMKNKYW